MTRRAQLAFTLLLVLSFAFCYGTRSVAAADDPLPLRSAQVMALVAGGALPEDVVHEIQADGLAFHANDSFRAQLKAAGANDTVLAALNAARVSPAANSDPQPDSELLQHYANAAQKMAANDFDGATAELKSALQSSVSGVDSGFVMGQILLLQNRYFEASVVYREVLRETQGHDYPDAHAKLSFALYKMEDRDESMREARAAVKQNSQDPEAHKTLCLAFDTFRQFDEATKECREAIRLKPGYASAVMDAALVLSHEGKQDEAIAEYKIALGLAPHDALTLYDLAYAYQERGDWDSAIEYYRKSIAESPTWFNPRQNLGHALMQKRMYAQAAAEFREMQKIFPDSEICHICLGGALYETSSFDEAEVEYRKAAQMEPGDAEPHLGLGDIAYQRQKYDESLQEYQAALQLDPQSYEGHRGAGSAYLGQKAFDKAVAEFKIAEGLNLGDPYIHHLYAQALLSQGNTTAAIEELKECLSLNPKQNTVALDLAAAYEKKGDWPNALDQYRRVADAVAALDHRNLVITEQEANAEKTYEDAQTRFKDHLAALRASGKTAEATTLEASFHSMQGTQDLSAKLNSTMQRGMQDVQQRQPEQALKDFQDAVTLARQIQPHDQRLVTALDYVGASDMGKDWPAADAAFQEELKVTQEIYGLQSPNLDAPLISLGNSALLQKNYAAAEKYYFQAVDTDEKSFGESSDRVAASLVAATRVYVTQQQWDKAEPYLLRALHIDESLYGKETIGDMIPLWSLCNIYDKWPKPDKAEACYEQALAIGVKQFGEDSPQLVSVLEGQSKALHALGRVADADKVDQRIASLRGATMKP